MVMDCAIYRGGNRETVDGDISDALDTAREQGEAFSGEMADPGYRRRAVVAR